jgi:DNA-binding YbaB/EbfC family protein
MKNLGKLMKQAQEMQGKMQEAQARLAEAELTGASGGGAVKVVMSGVGDVKSVKIDPSMADPAEVEILEDLIVAAFNDAKTKVAAHSQEEMSKITGGLDLPPDFKMPF